MKRRKHTKESLIDNIKKYYQDTGIVPTCDMLGIRHAVFSGHFGSFGEALSQAGFESDHHTKYAKNRNCGFAECKIEFIARSPEQHFCSTSCSNKSRGTRMVQVGRPDRSTWLLDIERRVEKRMLDPFDSLGWNYKRFRIMREQDNKCNHCQLSEWRGEVLPLEVDHIDGDRRNGSRENLEALCPNCHSITSTWRGRNKLVDKIEVTDTQLLQALIDTKNIRQALLSVDLAPKGGNYIRAKRLKNTHFNKINDIVAQLE